MNGSRRIPPTWLGSHVPGLAVGVGFSLSLVVMASPPSMSSLVGARPVVMNRSAQAPAPVVTVGPNVQITAARPTTMHGEGLIVSDPRNPRRLLVCTMMIVEPTGNAVAAYVSDDGGTHWTRTFESAPDDMAGDPACAYGPDGTAYLTMMILKTRRMATMRLPVWLSPDGGHTWERAGVTGGMDRDSIVVDQTNGRFRNRVYVHGTAITNSTDGLRRSELLLYTSADGGRTFGRPVERVSLGRRYIFNADNSVVLSDGRWLTVFLELKTYWAAPDANQHTEPDTDVPPEPENAWLECVWSDDGGDTLEQPVIVSGWHFPDDYVRESLGIAAVAADASNGPFRDRVYVVWTDARFGGTDILLSYSADRGHTWSAPMVVNDETRGAGAPPNHLLPAVTVNNAGVLAVTWLDRRDAPDNLGWRERIRVSLDGGETFLPSTAVATAPARFDGQEHWPALAGVTGGGTSNYQGGPLQMQVFAPRQLYIPGDYSGLAADGNGDFHPYWIDNRTGWHQAWTAAVHVAGKAVRNGSEELSGLDDLTSLVALDVLSSHYDRSTHTTSVTVRLHNTSPRALAGPFELRVIANGSDVALVEPIGAAKQATGGGAVWDLTPSIERARLAPGALGKPFTLSFALQGVRPFVQGNPLKYTLTLVHCSARLLGHVVE